MKDRPHEAEYVALPAAAQALGISWERAWRRMLRGELEGKLGDNDRWKVSRAETPRASTLALAALFNNWYLKEVTPGKLPGKQRHDKTCAEMFLRCFGEKRHPKSLNVRDWQKFIRDRRSGVLDR